MSRILFLVRMLEGGGAERQLLVLAGGLQRRGHEVTIAAYYSSGPDEVEIPATGVRYVSLEKRGFWDLVGFFSRMLRLARRLNPDVVHGYMDVGNIVAIALKPFLTSTRIVWGIRASNFDLTAYDLAGRVLSRMLVFVSRWVDLIICNSRAGAAHVVAHGYPGDRVEVVPNGVDTERFRPLPEAKARIRAEWGIGLDQPVIGLVARPDPMKDYANFTAAARILAARHPEARFVCAGDWIEPYRSAALQILRESGLGERLLWRGFVQDMPSFYNALDISTSSSAFGEGVSNAIAESMACGVPCAVTDVGDSRLLVGDLGIVVPPRNPAALADAWTALLERRSPEVSFACRARIMREFSVDALVERTERLLSPVAG
jgi:glycosyltransferase involved in cell wall biosynthesis